MGITSALHWQHSSVHHLTPFFFIRRTRKKKWDSDEESEEESDAEFSDVPMKEPLEDPEQEDDEDQEATLGRGARTRAKVSFEILPKL